MLRKTPSIIALVVLSTSCFQTPSLDTLKLRYQENTNKDVVQAYFTAVNLRDKAQISKLLSVNYYVHMSDYGWDKAWAIKKQDEMWAKDPQYHIEVHKIWISGDMVRSKYTIYLFIYGNLKKMNRYSSFKVSNHQITDEYPIY